MRRLSCALAAVLLLTAGAFAQQSGRLAARVLYPAEVVRGDALRGSVLGDGPLADLRVELQSESGRAVAAAPGFALDAGRRRWAFLLALPSTLAGGEYDLELTGGGPDSPWRYTGTVQVLPAAFPTEQIRFSPGLTRLLTQPDAQKEEESARLRAELEEFRPGSVWHTGPLRMPLQTPRQTSGFADRRQYLYADGGSSLSLHNGVDLAAPEGTPVAACASGRVVLAAERVLTGKSVVIEHLPGVYSLYFHLSEIAVAEGQEVLTGSRIGEVGSTGLATGPHLHWELRVNAQPVNPDEFLQQALVDKTCFSGIMDEP